MYLSFFNNVLNTLVRNVPDAIRIVISILLFIGAIFTLIFAIRVKNDKMPLSIGWIILTVILIALSAVYIPGLIF